MDLNHTHDPAARSWVTGANADDSDFPLQNLPLAVFRRAGHDESWRGGMAIGDQVLDLGALSVSQLVDGAARHAVQAAAQPELNALFGLGPAAWRALRHAAFALLREDAGADVMRAVRACLVPLNGIEFTLPARIGDYTDFYTSFDHALNSARMVDPQAEVAANFRSMPIGYHGRASTVAVSGQAFRRPWGQNRMPWESTLATYRPTRWLDYELEVAVWVGPGNGIGEPIPLTHAEQHIAGLGLLNDWSARDTQIWEMMPLGPFLAKSFATTVSPWIVTMEALAPYRQAWRRPPADPVPQPYLESPANRVAGAIDLQLEVWLESARGRREGTAATRLSRTSFRHQYWTVAQMLTHHTSGGCRMRPGDLLGSGTVSGPSAGEAGCLLELTRGGRSAVTLANGEARRFLDDGDVVRLRGWCEAPGRPRIGFGECSGEVLPAVSLPADTTAGVDTMDTTNREIGHA